MIHRDTLPTLQSCESMMLEGGGLSFTGPVAQLVQHPVLTMVNQIPVGNPKAGLEYQSTQPSYCFQKLIFRSMATSRYGG